MVSDVFGFWVTGEGAEVLDKRQSVAVAVAKAGGAMQIASEHAQYGKGGGPLIGKWMRVVVPEESYEAFTALLSDHGIGRPTKAPDPLKIPAMA